MRTLLLGLLLLSLLPAIPACGKREEPKPGSQSQDSGGYIDELRKAHHHANEIAALLPARSAIEAFQALHGRWPKDLDELAKDNMPVPPPPKGMKYDYKPDSGQIDLIPAQ